MKVQELINELKKWDPNSEVVVGGVPIYFIEELPGYYDGSYCELIQDDKKKPYYNIDGIKFTRAGKKVSLNIMSIEDVLWNVNTKQDLDNVKIEIDKSMSEDSILSINNRVNNIKKEIIDFFNKEEK